MYDASKERLPSWVKSAFRKADLFFQECLTMRSIETTAAKLSVFKMTWPIFIEILLQMMVGNVDQFMLSHYSFRPDVIRYGQQVKNEGVGTKQN